MDYFILVCDYDNLINWSMYLFIFIIVVKKFLIQFLVLDTPECFLRSKRFVHLTFKCCWSHPLGKK